MQAEQLNIISRKEVLQHNTIDDCWLIIQNHIYNFTEFIKHHPGGKDILLSRAGEDATSYFIGKHGKNNSVIKQLERLKIGVLPIEEQLKVNDFEEPYLMELIDRLYKEKLYNTPNLLKNKFIWIRTLNIILFFTFSIFALYGNLAWWLAIILVLFQAFIGTSLFGFIAHEATHRNFPKNNFLKEVLNFSWPVFWPFISQFGLRYEHNSHHIKIGDPEYDYEVEGLSSLIRYSGYVTPNFFHKYQHKIALYIYPFYANIITTFGGIKSNFWSNHNRKKNLKLRHNISILGTALYYILIPTLIMNGGFLKYAGLYLIYQSVLFFGIYMGAALNHFIPPIFTKIPEIHENKYAYYVCHNTSNFCTDSKFWFWYTGGFNTQLEHHLIPFIPVENLPKMIPIVKELCAKYNYPYHEYKSMKDLWNAHYAFLEIMSKAENNESANLEKSIRQKYEAR